MTPIFEIICLFELRSGWTKMGFLIREPTLKTKLFFFVEKFVSVVHTFHLSQIISFDH